MDITFMLSDLQSQRVINSLDTVNRLLYLGYRRTSIYLGIVYSRVFQINMFIELFDSTLWLIFPFSIKNTDCIVYYIIVILYQVTIILASHMERTRIQCILLWRNSFFHPIKWKKSVSCCTTVMCKLFTWKCVWNSYLLNGLQKD